MHPTVTPVRDHNSFAFCFSTPKPSGHTTRPFSRPSAGVVEGVERQGCRESREGQGWPFVACPWNGAGARGPRQSRGRMQGQAVLVTFAAIGKSDAPCRAQPVVRAEESAASKTQTRKAKRQEHRPQAGSYKNISCRARHNRTPPMRNRCIASRMHPTVVSRSRPQQLGLCFSAFLLRFLAFPNQNHQATPLAPSAGRAQVSWKGLSGRDAARAARAMDGPSWRALERHRREGTPAKPGPDAGVAFSLVTFSWRDKRK